MAEVEIATLTLLQCFKFCHPVVILILNLSQLSLNCKLMSWLQLRKNHQVRKKLKQQNPLP